MVITLDKLASVYSQMVNISYIQIFIFLVVLDVISGFAKGFSTKTANSTKGLTGVIKHLLVIVLVLTVYPYLTLLGANWVGTMFILFFIASYAISVIENYGQLGLPFPTFAKKYFEKLRQSTENIEVPSVNIGKDGITVPAKDVEHEVIIEE